MPHKTILFITYTILSTVFSLTFSLSCTQKPNYKQDHPGVFVLGVDGMDPLILQRLIDEGKMPAFKKLSSGEGFFKNLGTSTPPQSPVAWSNFATGTTPDKHGIFDFIHRDPQTYKPVSSATSADDASQNAREGTPFWDTLQKAGIKTEIYRMPGNYPVPKSPAATLSGMGTVDLRGGYGTYSWYTDTPPDAAKELKADLHLIRLNDESTAASAVFTAALNGPNSPTEEGEHLKATFNVHVDKTRRSILIELDGQTLTLSEGQWSPWATVSFEFLPLGIMPLDGMVRFYLKSTNAPFALYATPINIDPRAAEQPISTPDNFAEEIATHLGPYFTQGMPEETNALKDGLFDDDDYEKQVALVHDEGQKMHQLALERFEAGQFTFVYVSNIDLQSHMLWRHGDPKYPNAPMHPAHNPFSAEQHRLDIENHYIEVDNILADTLAGVPKETRVVVMSDHGFQPFTRTVNLNTWLMQEGYLFLKEGKSKGRIGAGDIDWSKTKAYTLGFNGLYLNREGREAQGIVRKDEAILLKKELEKKLLALSDSYFSPFIKTDCALADKQKDYDCDDQIIKTPILSLFSQQNPGHFKTQPDLFIGYNKGYGASDGAALGEVGPTIFANNTSAWSGNHLMAAEVVPGVLLSNYPKSFIKAEKIEDLAALFMKHYEIIQ